MKLLWVFAHPEQRSLSAALRDEGISALIDGGHEYQRSDLYAMGWKPVVDSADFPQRAGDRLIVTSASKYAYTSGTLSADISVEQAKLEWADTVIVQFPLWWMGVPAILKGWFDRVFVKGFAYGVKEPPSGRTLRYGDGGLAGKRAMVIVTVGAPEVTIGPRGIHGDMDNILFGLQHGTFWYSGMSVVPPLVIPAADHISAADYRAAAAALRDRLQTLPTAPPIPFRSQDGGDYDEHLVLRQDLAPGRDDLGVHYARSCRCRVAGYPA
ncbi:MAG: NAD(P)H-dependent oxidoreductase [Sciscionella sp.]